MIAYFDTSAAVPLIIDEPSSAKANRIWDDATRISSVRLLYPEASAALARAERMRCITKAQLVAAVAELDSITTQIDHVEITAYLARAAGELARAHGLRGYDAVHLAAVLAARDDDLVFVTGDGDLGAAANVARGRSRAHLQLTPALGTVPRSLAPGAMYRLVLIFELAYIRSMDIDAIATAGLVTRTVETVDRNGRPAKLVIAGRTYPTGVEDLWDAVTNVERIPRWFLPITGDLRPGGRYQLEGNAAGEILQCDPPRRFEITWEYGGEISWVTVELRDDAEAGVAHLELRHLAHVPDDRWDQYGPGAVGVGWDLGLLGLGLHLARGETVDPEKVESWQRSPAGRGFIVRSSTAWGEASIAGGTGAEPARAAAARVTDFYAPADE